MTAFTVAGFLGDERMIGSRGKLPDHTHGQFSAHPRFVGDTNTI